MLEHNPIILVCDRPHIQETRRFFEKFISERDAEELAGIKDAETREKLSSFLDFTSADVETDAFRDLEKLQLLR